MDDEGTTSVIKDPSAFTALTKIHKQPVLECCFSPDTEQVLTGSEDTTVVLWNLPSHVDQLHDDTINDEHKLVCYRLSDHKTPVMSVAIHKRLFLSASKDGQVKLWKLLPDTNHSSLSGSYLPTFKQPSPEPSTYTCHTRIIRSTTFSHDARCFATASDDKSVKIWSSECRNKMLVSLLDGHTNWIKSVRWSKTNEFLLASCGDDGKICIWDTRTKVRQPPCVSIAARRRMQFNCLDWHPVFEHHLATGAQDSSCVVWDLRNRKQVQVYLEHNGSVNSVAFNSGGSLLLSGSSDKTSKIFDVCEGRNMFTLMSHTAPVTSVCFNESGEMFATASQDKTVTVWKRNFETINIVLEDERNDLDETNLEDLEGDCELDVNEGHLYEEEEEEVDEDQSITIADFRQQHQHHHRHQMQQHHNNNRYHLPPTSPQQQQQQQQQAPPPMPPSDVQNGHHRRYVQQYHYQSQPVSFRR